MYARARCPKPKMDNSLVNPPKGLQNPRSALGESHQFTPPCLQYFPLCKRRVCKRKPVPLVSNTCHPRQVPCMQEHNTYVACKTRQTQPSRLLILTGLQNPRPALGKPQHKSIGLTKPKANTSLVQGSTNPRSTLGETLSITKFHPHGNSTYVRSTLDNFPHF